MSRITVGRPLINPERTADGEPLITHLFTFYVVRLFNIEPYIYTVNTHAYTVCLKLVRMFSASRVCREMVDRRETLVLTEQKEQRFDVGGRGRKI